MATKGPTRARVFVLRFVGVLEVILDVIIDSALLGVVWDAWNLPTAASIDHSIHLVILRGAP